MPHTVGLGPCGPVLHMVFIVTFTQQTLACQHGEKAMAPALGDGTFTGWWKHSWAQFDGVSVKNSNARSVKSNYGMAFRYQPLLVTHSAANRSTNPQLAAGADDAEQV